MCCQQYSAASRGSSTRRLAAPNRATGDVVAPRRATARRHGRPLAVTPRHVVEGFLESDRSRRDSGVFTKKGIFELAVEAVPRRLVPGVYLVSLSLRETRQPASGRWRIRHGAGRIPQEKEAFKLPVIELCGGRPRGTSSEYRGAGAGAVPMETRVPHGWHARFKLCCTAADTASPATNSRRGIRHNDR